MPRSPDPFRAGFKSGPQGGAFQPERESSGPLFQLHIGGHGRVQGLHCDNSGRERKQNGRVFAGAAVLCFCGLWKNSEDGFGGYLPIRLFRKFLPASTALLMKFLPPLMELSMMSP